MRHEWIDTGPRCSSGDRTSPVLIGLCVFCFIFVLFSAAIGASPTAREKVTLQCRSLLERFTTKPVQLAESTKKTFAGTDSIREEIQDAGKHTKTEASLIADQAFDPTTLQHKYQKGVHEHVNASKSMAELSADITNSVNVHRCVTNTQNGFNKIHPNSNLLHDISPFIQRTKERLNRESQNKGSDCDSHPVFYSSSHQFDHAPGCG